MEDFLWRWFLGLGYVHSRGVFYFNSDGEILGTVGTDTVTVGGLAIQNQTIELAKTLSTQFTQDTGDGLLGLAFGSINTVTPGPAQTPVEVRFPVAKKGLLPFLHPLHVSHSPIEAY